MQSQSTILVNMSVGCKFQNNLSMFNTAFGAPIDDLIVACCNNSTSKFISEKSRKTVLPSAELNLLMTKETKL